MKRIFLMMFVLVVSVSAMSFGAGTKETQNAAQVAKKVHLTFWHYYTGPVLAAVNRVVAQYNAMPSAKAMVTAQFLPRTQLLRRYTLGVVSGQLPDLAMVDNPDSAALAAMGMFKNLTARFSTWSDNHFLKLPLDSGKYDGKLYTIPLRSNDLALWGNDQMLRAAGITKLPTTWQELLADGKRLKSTYPKDFAIAFAAVKNEQGTFQFLPFLQSAGATAYTIGSPAGIKALTFMSNLVKDGYASPEVIDWTQPDVEKQFASGNAAMMINGPWEIPSVAQDAPDMKYSVSPIPKDKAFSNSLGGENIGITKATKDMKAAWAFLTWFTSTPISIEFTKVGGTISAHSNVSPGAEYPNDPIMKVFIEQLAYAVPRGPNPKWPEISSAIQDALQQSLSGASSPEAAAKEAGAKIAKINASLGITN